MQVTKLQAVLVADTRQFDADLLASRKTIEAFHPAAARALSRIEKDFGSLEKATGLSKETFETLKRSVKDTAAMTAASKALDRLAKSGALTEDQLEKLSKSMGFVKAQPVTDQVNSIEKSLTRLRKSGALTDEHLRQLRQTLGASDNANIADAFNKGASAASSLSSAIAYLKSAAAGYIGYNFLGDTARTAVDIASLQKTFYALTGTFEGARAEMGWLREESQRLGLDFFSLAESFKGFSAAGKSAGMDVAQVRDIFTSVSEASAVLGLNSQKTQLALYALEQMLSKGVVSMEELRRQLGDQLPGAFQLAAKSMGMTTQAFAKLVESGQVSSTEFLLKFSKTLREQYGHGLAEAIKTPRAEIQRLNNQIAFSKQIIGDGGFLQGLSGAAREITSALSSSETQANLAQFGHTIGTITGFMAKLATLGIEYGQGIATLAIATKGASLVSSGFLLVSKNLTGVLNTLALSTTQQTVKNNELAASFARVKAAQIGVGGVAKGVGGALLGAVGGLPGLALTAAIGGFTYLATRQSESEKVAALYGDTMARVRERLIAVGNAAELAGDKAVRSSNRINEVNIREAKKALESAQEELAPLKKELLSFDIFNAANISRDYSNSWVKNIINDVNQVRRSYADGKIDIEEYIGSLRKIKKTVEESGRRDTNDLPDAISRLIEMGPALESVFIEIDKANKVIQGISVSFRDMRDAAQDAAIMVRNLASFTKSFEDKANNFLKPMEDNLTNGIAALKKLSDASSTAQREAADAEYKAAQEAGKTLLLRNKGDAKKTEEIKKQLKQAEETYKERTRRYTKQGADSFDRPAFQMSTAFKDAENALEQFRLRKEQLASEIKGDSFGAAMTKAAKDYDAQLGKVDKSIDTIKANLASWQKNGKADSEVAKNAQLALENLEKQKVELAAIRSLEEERARIADRLATAQASASYNKLRGNAQGSYQAEIDTLNIKLKQTDNLAKQLEIMEQIRRLEARRDLNPRELIKTGWRDQAVQAWEDYADFFQNGVPGAFASASNAFGDMVGNVLTGTESLGDAWSNLGKSLQRTLSQMASDFLSATLRMVIFGKTMQSFGGGFGLSPGSGASFSVPSWVGNFGVHHSGGFIGENSAARSALVSTFAGAQRFHAGGVLGLKPNEVPIIGMRGEEVLTSSDPRHRDNLRPRAMSGGAVAPQVNLQVNIENNTSAQVRASATQDTAGNPVLNIQIIEQIDGALAQRVYNGRSSIGQAIDRTRGTSNARMLYRK